jgi:hypothetical protein
MEVEAARPDEFVMLDAIHPLVGGRNGNPLR